MSSERVDILTTFDQVVKPELLQKLPEAQSTDEVVQAVQLSIAPILDPQGAAVGNLRRDIADATRQIVAIMLGSVKLVPQASRVNLDSVPVQAATKQPWLLTAGVSATTAAVTSKVLSFTASPLVGIPVGVAAGYAAHKLTGPTERALPKPSMSFKVDAAMLLSRLRETIVDIESACNHIAEQTRKADAAIDPVAVWEFAQQTLARNHAGESVSPPHVVKSTAQFLWKFGVVAKHYDSTEMPAVSKHWAVRAEDDVASPIGILPQLRRDDDVVFAGLVLVPRAKVIVATGERKSK